MRKSETKESESLYNLSVRLSPDTLDEAVRELKAWDRILKSDQLVKFALRKGETHEAN
jgi:hypothetical protein